MEISESTIHRFRRSAFGILALICLAIGLYYSVHVPEGLEIWTHGVTIRIGIVLGAIWLAYPELQRVPRWLYVVLLIGSAVVMIQPRLIVLVGPAIVFLWMLRWNW